MFKALKKLFFKKDTLPASLEYLVSCGSGQFILRTIDKTKTLNTFHEHESNKIERWANLNGYHIAERFETVI